jgi:hypothetical protein
MVKNFVRRPLAGGAVLSLSFLTVAVGCDKAIETPFFDESHVTQGGSGGATQGGGSGVATGGAAGSGIGGDVSSGGSSTGGDAGMSGAAGSGALGGTGSGGVGGDSNGGVSGTTTGGTGGTSVDCTLLDPTAVSFGEHCYVFRQTPRTWPAAREDCASDGAHLVTIGSDDRSEEEFAAENQFVWSLGGMTEVWIGATDGRPSNQSGNGTPYAWITGESIAFDRWSSGQPNNSQSACMENAPCSCGNMCWEHCAFMWEPNSNEPATWNDRHCEHVIGYVCEWDEPPP